MAAMSQALRRTSFWTLLVAELILIGLFSASIAVKSGGSFEMGCLLLHCGAIVVILGTELFTFWCGGRDSYDVTYCVSSGNVLFFVVLAASLFAYRFADDPLVTEDFIHVGDPLVTSYATLVLSWLAVLLALNCMIFTCIDKRRAKFGEFKVKVDWSQRPLPLVILNVQQNSDPARFIHPEKPSPVYPMRTTYNSWPGEV